MISEYTFFCVGCSSVVDKEKAERVFRTGYYKVSMRLGICMACEHMNNQLEEAYVIDAAAQPESYMEGHII
jgi:hypothetical protein